MAIAFDGENLLITVTTIGSYNVRTDIYSDWKVYTKIGNNAKYPMAFGENFGGNPYFGETVSRYYPFRNDSGWRIKMPEASGEVTFVGNLFPNDEAIDTFLPPDGAFTVLIRQNVSPQSITVTGAVAASAVADAVWDEATSGHVAAGSFGKLVQDILKFIKALL